MANTFYSTLQAFIAGRDYTAGAYTASLIATAHFFKIRLTNSGGHFDLNDDAMDAGTTTPNCVNYFQSWTGPGQPGPQVGEYIQTTSSTINSNFQNSWLNLATAGFTTMRPHITDAASSTVAFGSPSFTSSRWTGKYGGVEMIRTASGGSSATFWIYFAFLAVDPTLPGSIKALIVNVQAPVIANYKYVAGNWGRYGMVIPDYGSDSESAYLVAPGKVCSLIQTQGDYLVPSDEPLSWMPGPYGQSAVCPQSRCIYYPINPNPTGT